MSQESGSSFAAPSDGKLVLTFDNSYSWVARPSWPSMQHSAHTLDGFASLPLEAVIPEVKAKDIHFELSKLPAEAGFWHQLGMLRGGVQDKDDVQEEVLRLSESPQDADTVAPSDLETTSTPSEMDVAG